METFLQAVGLILVGLVLTLVVGRQSRDMALLLSLAVCAGVCTAAVGYLSALTDFLGEIRVLGGLDREYISILFKCAGIGFLAEIAGLVCSDAGESAMGKALQILANAAVLFLSLPLLRRMLELLEEVLGQV